MSIKLKKDLIIAIDGYASCGKSTLAKALAKTLKYMHIDTGAMYRAVTLYAIENNLVGKDFDKQLIIDHLHLIDIDMRFNSITNSADIYLNGRNVNQEIRTNKLVAMWVSAVAEVPQVREFLVKAQQKLGKDKRIVMDGRDIGTVVFPDAEIKLFLTASPQERARRRYLELKAKGLDVKYEEIFANIQKRDKIDSSRAISPLKPAPDAVIIDNTNINQREQYAMVMALIIERYGFGLNFSE